MIDDIIKIFGIETTIEIGRSVSTCRDQSITPEIIARNLEHIHEIKRDGMALFARATGDKETTKKIEIANKIIQMKRIQEFKEAVASGKEQEFLDRMSWIDKISLEVNMDLKRIIDTKKPLTEEEQKYLDILEKSIDNDIENEALRQGFSSVEEWQKHNAAKYGIQYGSIENIPIDIYLHK